jgi:response regulator RpfG family c-di-GMP phosphodiesterase
LILAVAVYSFIPEDKTGIFGKSLKLFPNLQIMKNILILENGKIIKSMVGKLSKNENYKIINPTPVSGNLKDSKIPDLVIADLTSIKNKKVEILMKLKSNPVISLVPFLLIISENKDRNENPAIQNYYLDKPFTADNLYKMIDKIFRDAERASPW